jgi:hypothetical protein
MAAIITEKFRQHNAEQFFESFSEAAASNYYLFIGKASPFTTSTSGGTDTTPPTPQDIVTVENYKWDSMLAAKKIGPTDVSYVIPRRNYANGTIYDMYEHDIATGNAAQSGALNLYDATFYFMTDEYKVYKVLDNNNGAAIAAGVSGPTSTSSTPFFEGGYYLQYMYTLTTSEVQKFVTSDFIPVKTDAIVSADTLTASGDTAPYHGAPIKVVRVTAGSGYSDTNGTNGSGGAGGIYYSPIRGDGTGGKVKIVVSGGEIQPFGSNATTSTQIEAAGEGYTYGVVNLNNVYSDAALTTAVSIGSGTAGTVVPIISPKVGHGFNGTEELGGHFVMMNTKLEQTETDDFAIGNDFREVGILVDPTTAGTTTVATVTQARMTYAVKFASSTGTFEPDEKITQAANNATGRVVEFDASKNILYYQQEQWENYGIDSNSASSTYQQYVAFTGTNTITGATSGATGTPTTTSPTETLTNGGTITFSAGGGGFALPELEQDSGKLIYVENRRPISRASDQTEDIKIVVEF